MTLALELAAGAVAFLALGQLVPRAVARRWPTRLVPALLPVIRGTAWIFAPSLSLARAVVRPLRHAAAKSPDAAVRDGIEELLRDSELEGIGERGENVIISGVVHFGETRVGAVMTPRADVFALDAALPPAELARAVAESGYSRVPLFRGTLDDVAGMVHAFDVLEAERDERLSLRPVASATPDTPCSAMLFDMLRRRQHLGVVRHATGRLEGIVTLEDLLEALVGEIRDEHDEPDELTIPALER